MGLLGQKLLPLISAYRIGVEADGSSSTSTSSHSGVQSDIRTYASAWQYGELENGESLKLFNLLVEKVTML